jgi:transcriptional regulator with XRE-family HTH domain
MTGGPTKAVGARLRETRADAGLSQAELARRLGVTQAAISNWESGTRQPSLDDLYALAGELEVTVYDLLPRPDGPPVRAALRGVAERLESISLANSIDEFVDYADSVARPGRRIWSQAGDPVHASAELLERLKVTRPPVDVHAVADACGISVVEWRFDESLSGLVIDTDTGPIIGNNSGHSRNRKRFTVGHELGHVVLRHLDTFHIDLGTAAEDGHPPNYNWRHERAANDFSANLLMPANLVRKAYQQHPSIRRLAQDFEVSELAMGFRVDDLGLK